MFCDIKIPVEVRMDLTEYQQLELSSFYGKANILVQSEFENTPEVRLGYEKVVHVTLNVDDPEIQRQGFTITNNSFRLYSVTLNGEPQITAHAGNQVDAGVYKVKQFTNPVWIAPAATVEYTPLVDNDGQRYWVVSGPEDPGFYDSTIYTTQIRKPLWLDYNPETDQYWHPEDWRAYNGRLVVFKPLTNGLSQTRFSIFNWDVSDLDQGSEYALTFHLYNNLDVPVIIDYGYRQWEIHHTSSPGHEGTRMLLPGRMVEVASRIWDIQIIGDLEVGYD